MSAGWIILCCFALIWIVMIIVIVRFFAINKSKE